MRHVRNAPWMVLGSVFLALGCSGNRTAGPGVGSGGANIGPGDGASGGAMYSGGATGSVPIGTGGGFGGSAGVGALSEPTFRDGTRLVAQTYLSAGAAPLFVGIYDRQERVACGFRVATDGKMRCLPPSQVNVSDPGPAGRWLEGTEVMGADTGLRLRRVLVLTPDGAAFPNWISGELGDDMYWKPCRPTTTREADGTGEGACLPLYASYSGLFFADAACTQPLAQGGWGSAVMPLLIVAPKFELFRVGATFTGPVFIQYGPGGSCTDFTDGTVPSGNDYYHVGEPLPASAAATLRIAPRGTGRLALQTVEFEGVALTPVRHQAVSAPYGQGPYFDRDLGALCRPTWTVGDELRCLPDAAAYVPERSLTLAFADPNCTQPVLNDDRATVVVLRMDATQGRQEVFEVRKLGLESTKTAYSRETNPERECREFPKGAGKPLGDVVPLDSFAAVEMRTGQE